MGQIQNSISGLAEKVALAKTGKDLLQSDKEMQAIQAQDKASLYADTELKDANMKAFDAGEDLTAAIGKATRLFDKYGVKQKWSKEGDLSIGSMDQSKLSKSPRQRTRQFKMLLDATSAVGVANAANRAAMDMVGFKEGQYEAFRKRAEVLSKKAKLDMPKSLSKDGMIDREVAWASEYSKGGKK